MTPQLHFTRAEFDARRARLEAVMAARNLDAMLIFAPETQFWLTGYDTFGFCFFQCLVLRPGADYTLLTRSADLRQAQLTSIIQDIRIWRDGAGAEPTRDLSDLLDTLGCRGQSVGVETDTHGLTAMNGKKLEQALEGQLSLIEASDIVPDLRLTKSEAEIAYVRRAAELADDALDAALDVAGPGADEGDILAAMQGAVFKGGGDYPANEFIIGSGEKALLCRHASGRRKLSQDDQLTLEWAGTYRHYHAAMMNTLVIGTPRPQHITMHAAASEALLACEAALVPGNTLGDVFAAHKQVFAEHGLAAHSLNACGYALGARFTPGWMEPQMMYANAPTIIAPGMVFFLHMILMDSDSGTAMVPGRTSLVTDTGAEVLTRHSLEMVRL